LLAPVDNEEQKEKCQDIKEKERKERTGKDQEKEKDESK
jgi:hypothetical protein